MNSRENMQNAGDSAGHNNSTDDSGDFGRLSALFHKLDLDGDGRIDLGELIAALAKAGHSSTGAKDLAQSYVQRFMQRTDVDKSGDVSIDEFLDHIRQHERKLREVFKEVDRNNNGQLDVQEVIEASRKLGIVLTFQEAEAMIKRMDDDGSYDISWEEWRDFLMLSPSDDLKEVVSYWRQSTFLDIGEAAAVPQDFTPQELKSGLWWRHLVSGGLAGAVSRTSTAPLDRIKVFLQVHGKNSPLTSNGVMGCFRAMIKEGGVFSMWRGNGINVIKIAPETAIKFMAYEQLKTLIKGRHPNKEIRIEERFIAGSLAGAISQTAIYPLEVIKTKLALRKTGEFKNVFDLVQKMFVKEGWKAFYKGYLPNLIGILPYAGIDLAIYESLKRAYLRNEPSKAPPVLILLACGTISSTCGQIASYPLALVRTQLQASYTSSNQSMTVIFKTILRNEGIGGLYRGILPNFLKVAPAVSISYLVYERVRGALGVKMT